LLTGYTEWHGRHLFLDTQGSVSYGNFDGTRTMDIGSQARSASGKRAEEMVALGANLGASFNYRALEISPHFSLDGLSMREEGYTEVNGGDGLDLQVAPNYSNSLRAGIGTDFKLNLHVWDFSLSPEARIGYRYDALNDPVKLKAGFVSTGGLSTVNNTMTFIGPDPDSGNIFAGMTVGASTENWELGINYDVVRGNNGSTTQVGTLSLLGRI
jgi:Autotransporter beta-domain